MTIPTLEWFPTSITGDLGSYQAWNLDPIDAEVMIMALIDTLKIFLKTNAAFDNITIYTQATATSPNVPRTTKAISVAGTASTGNEAAVSRTWNFKTSGNNNAKIALLDTPIPATWFNRIQAADFNSGETDVADQISFVSNAWSGRDDNHINSCRSITMDLNDKLQRMYFK
jgi:cellobiose phosphorylase